MYTESIYNALLNAGAMIKSKFGRENDLTKDNVCRLVKYIPEDYQETILDYVENNDIKGKTLNEILDLLDKGGLLRFKPYISYMSNDCPVLVLKYNRFLYLAKGRQYQVTYTAQGIGIYNQASVSLNKILDCFVKSLNNTKLFQTLAYMNMIEAGKGLHEFDKLLKKDNTLLDEFFRKSIQFEYNLPSIVSLEDISNMVIKEDIAPKGNSIFRLAQNNMMDLCRVYTCDGGDVYLEIMYDGMPKTIRFELPEINLTDELLLEFDMEPEEFEDYLIEYIYNNPDVRTQILVFALGCIDIIINHMLYYKIGEQEQVLKRLNDSMVQDVLNVDTFIRYFKDVQNKLSR